MRTRRQTSPQSLDSKMLPQTLPYTASFSSVTSHFFIFFLILFLPSIPYPPPSPSHIYPLIKSLYALLSNSSLNPSGGLEAPWGKIFFWQLSWDRKEVLDRSIFHPRKFLILPDALSQTVLLCRCTFKGSQDMYRGQISEPDWKTLNCSCLWFLCFNTTLKFK